MVAVRDVALRAGVSTSTVSHVLNGTRFVSATLRERVISATHELDYQPNAAARSLVLKRTGMIGLIVSDIRDPFCASLSRGVEDAARDYGYSVMLCNSDEDATRASGYLNSLRTRQVDGLLVASGGAGQAHLARLVRAGLPLVLVDRKVPELAAPAVVCDNAAVTYAAVQHLLRRGHARVGLLAGSRSVAARRERVAGYRRALAEARLELDKQLVISSETTREAGAHAMEILLDLPAPPTAVLSAHALLTLGVLQTLARRHVRVPDQVAVSTFDDLPYPWSETLQAHVTTIARPSYELGRAAMETLVRLLRQPHAPIARRVLVAGPLTVRD